MLGILVFTLSTSVGGATAAPCNFSSFTNIAQLAHYFHQVDPRRTFDQYAKATGQSLRDVKKQFSATGSLRCYDTKNGYEETTANVVGRNNLIAGSGHVLFDDDCTPRSIKGCEFRLLNQPSHVYKIKVDTAAVQVCTKGKIDSLNDWFSAFLTERTTATPYLIPDSPIRPNVGDQLTQVAAEATNGFKGKPNIVNCSVMNAQYRMLPYLTDCSVGHGASGGAQLTPAENKRWTLNAIVSKENPLGHDGGEFDLSGTYTSSAPVSGQFWQTLHDMANSDEVTTTSGPHDRDSY